jgi:putative ABC transport system permease protein
MIVLSVVDDASSQKIEERIRSVMGRRYDFSPRDKNVLFFNNLEQQVDAFNSFFSSLTKFLWLMGLSTLFSGIVGVTNIMYCVAKERTKEIGLRKALGARNSSIRKLFIGEAVFLTSIAGYAGMMAGALILKLIGYFINVADKQPLFEKPIMDWRIALATTLILTFAGTAAGFMPAIYASRLNPIDALRQE